MRVASCFLLLTFIGGASSTQAQSDDASLRRYVELLERQPKFGTVFDKIYAAQAERGTLAEFVAGYQQLMNEKRDGGAALIVGLVELQRGRDADAIAALRVAEQLRASDAQPSLVLSRALLLIGDLDGALTAFDRALMKKPNRMDVLDAALTLGQSLLRAARTEDAARVWRRVDELFPDDARVQERLATTISRGGDHAAAAVRLEKLSRAATEPNQRVQFKIRILEEQVLGGTKLGDVLGQFEAMQSDLKLDSWLAKDVGQRVEQLFLRTEDLAGLTAYYRKQAAARPEYIGVQTRLAELLVRRGKSDDAIGVLSAAIEKHPTNAGLRRTLIGVLLKSRRFAEAQKQHAELDRLEPKNSETLRGWGLAVLQDESQPQADRSGAALAIWMRLVDADNGNKGGPAASALPLTLLQTAELLRRHGFENEALGLYRRAVEAAPQEAQYREDLGEYLLLLGRRDEALSVWREIASGERATHENRVRLAQVLHRAGERDEALRVMTDACRDEATIDELLKLAEWNSAARRAEDVASVLSRAARLAKSDDEQQCVQHAELDWLIASNKLFDEIARAKQRAEKDRTAASWQRLAVLQRASRHWDDALQAIRRAVAIEPQSVALQREAAQIALSAERYQEALTLYRKLLELDRSHRADVLRQVATLESRLGRAEAALQAAREMTEAAPGNREYIDFFVNLCLKHGRVEEALQALRRASRANPSDVGLLLQVAGVLASHDRVMEAIEFGWQGYEAATEPREQVRIAERLALWHQQVNRFPACVERHERRKREPANEYSATLSLAAAYRAVGDFDSARKELATQLTARPDDVELLRQLVLDAEAHHHWSDAVDFQSRLVERQPTIDERIKLVLLTDHSGDQAAAIARARELAVDLRELPAFLAFVDALIDRGRFELAARILDERHRAARYWDLSVRLGIALWRTGRTIGARERFADVLEMTASRSERSARGRGVSTVSFSGATRSQTPFGNAADEALLRVGDTGFGAKSADAREAELPARRSQTEFGNEWSAEGEIEWQKQAAAWGIAAYLIPKEFEEKPRSLPRDFGEARIAARAALALIEWFTFDSDERFEVSGKDAVRDRQLRNSIIELKTIESRLQRGVSKRFELEVAQPNQPTKFERSELWEWYHALAPLASKANTHCVARVRIEAASRLAQSGDVVGQWALLQTIGWDEDTLDGTFFNDALLAGVGTDQNDHPRLEELPALLKLLEECRLAVANSPYEWMKKPSSRVDATVVKEDSLQSAADLLKLPHARRPAEIDPKKFGEWVSEAIRQNDAATYLGLFEFDSLQAARLDDRIAGMLDWEKPPMLGVASPMSDAAYFYDESVRESFDRLSASAVWRRRTGQARLRIVYDTPADSIRTPFMADVVDQLARPFAEEDAALRHARCRNRMLLVWKSGQKDAALKMLQAAVEETPQHYPLRFELALLLRELGRPKDAVEALRDAPVSDWKSLYHRDRSLVEFGQEARDDVLVKAAAHRLATLKASVDVDWEIVEILSKLSLNDLGLIKLSSLRQRAGGNLDQLNRVLNSFLRLKAFEQAAEVAHEMLQLVPEYPEKSQGTYTLTSTTHVAHAEQALKEANRATLNRLAAKVDADLVTHPNARRSRELQSLYQRLLGGAKAAPNEPALIGDVAKMTSSQLLDRSRELADAHQDAAAGELALTAYRREPSLLVKDFETARRILVPAKPAADLLTLIVERKLLDEKAVREPATELALDSLSDALNHDAATKLLTSVWPVIPTERLDDVGRISHGVLWGRESDFSRWAQQTVVPQTIETGKRRWLGIIGTAHIDRSGNGRCALTRQLDVSDRVSLRNATQTALNKYPQWKTGEIILALLDAKDGRGDAYERRLIALAADEDLPAEVQFFIAQESARILSVERMASRVIHLLVKRPHRETREFSLDPARVLAGIYRRSGQHDELVRLLTDWLKRQDSVRGDFENATDAEQLRAFRNAIVVMGQLFNAEADTDAMRIGLETTRRYVASTSHSPSKERLEIASGLSSSTHDVLGTKDVAQRFLADWLPDDRSVELFSVLRSGTDGTSVSAANLMETFLERDGHCRFGMMESELLARLQRRPLADDEITTRVAILQLEHADRDVEVASLERDYEQLIDAAARAKSDAALLDIAPLLDDGLQHSAPRVRALAQQLADRVLAAARRTSPHWEAAVINELLTAAHAHGDFVKEDELLKRLRELKLE